MKKSLKKLIVFRLFLTSNIIFNILTNSGEYLETNQSSFNRISIHQTNSTMLIQLQNAIHVGPCQTQQLIHFQISNLNSEDDSSIVFIQYFIKIQNISIGILIYLKQQKQADLSKMRGQIAELIAGHFAGWSITTVGQPLDYLKTLSQLNKPIKFSQLFTFHHFKTFYRGSSSLYLFSGSTIALEFFVFENTKAFLDSIRKSDMNYFIAGSTVGAVISFLYTPNDFVKIEAQISTDSKPKGSLLRLIHYLTRQPLHQGIRKIYTGISWCLLREIPGSSFSYGGFHFFLTNLFKNDRDEANKLTQFASGLLSGMTYQLWAYPIDVFKTNCQAKSQNFRQLIQSKVWRLKSFWRGWGFSVSRGMITEAAGFTVYENVRKYLKSETVY